MKRCAIYVPMRHYGKPGPCESKRAIKRIQLGDTSIMACVAHRSFIAGGGKPELTKRVRCR